MARGVPRAFGSGLLLLGAFAVGGVLHGVAVEGSLDPLSPLAVGGVLLGAVSILVGWRLERAFDPSAYVPDGEEADEGEESFDEELSPVSAEALAEREADEGYEDR